MLSTTTEFQDELTTLTKARDLYGKVEFRQIDTTAFADCTPTSSSTDAISDINLINNDLDNPAINYATFENDRWVLDGSFKLLPSSSFLDMGWWGDFSNASNITTKLFTPNITITRTFTIDHSSIGITIFFDTLNNEYAEDFDIKYYDSSNALIQTTNVIANTESLYVDEFEVSNYRKVEIVLKKWCLGGRRARISEVLAGVSKEYSKSNGKLITFTQNEELDVTLSKIVPTSLDFSIDNQSKEYDILNPTGIYSYLQKTQEINCYIGAMIDGYIEYVSLGKFYLEDWKTNQNALEAKFSAIDILGLIEKKTYYKGLKQSITLYDLAVDVLQDYGLTTDNYNIDSSLSAITTTNFLPVCNYKEALQHIAIMSRCTVYVDRLGILQIKPINVISSGVTILRSGMRQPTPDITLSKLVKQVDVETTTITTAVATTTIATSTVNITGTQSFWVIYDKPASNLSASLDIGTIDSIDYYTNACYITISHTGTVVITVTGKELTLSSSLSTSLTGETDGETISIKSQLIDNTTIADLVGAYMVARYNERNLLTVEWRGNPSLTLDDIVDMETNFSTTTNKRIVKQSYEYNGGLKSRLEVLG